MKQESRRRGKSTYLRDVYFTLVLQTEIDEEELTALSNDLECAGKEHEADDDHNNAHGNFHVAHGLVVFTQNSGDPANAEGCEKEWDGEPG